MTTYFAAKELLKPPSERAAFSDRQAYVCAELSKLAYFKFEGGYTLDQALEIARDIFRDDERLKVLELQLRPLLTSAPSAAMAGAEALRKILSEADFDLVKTFSAEGTQAFVCTRKVTLGSGAKKTIAFLVFRGTEPTDFRDIKSDVKAALVKTDIHGESIELHTGYLEAFSRVREDVERTLKDTSYDQLFVTGHSLGGALAMVATRILASDITGACYTFGAPPIGTIDVQNGLKTPVYEIINEIDIVPRLPNPWMASGILLLVRLVRLLAKTVTVVEKVLASGTWDEKLETFVDSMTKYRHPGYISYLVGAGSSARLRYNVSSFDRLRWWFAMMTKKGFTRFNKMVADHSVDLYVAKLKAHAMSRQ